MIRAELSGFDRVHSFASDNVLRGTGQSSKFVQPRISLRREASDDCPTLKNDIDWQKRNPLCLLLAEAAFPVGGASGPLQRTKNSRTGTIDRANPPPQNNSMGKAHFEVPAMRLGPPGDGKQA